MSTEATSTEATSTEALKRIVAFIHPHLEARVIRALHDLPEFPGFSIVEARGQGRGRGIGGAYVASEYDLVYQRHLRLEIVCRAGAVEGIADLITRAAWTGRRGDGVIFVTDVERFERIRETGAAQAGQAPAGEDAP